MSDSVTEILARNLHEVRQNIASACEKSHRTVQDVRLVAVTKSAELDWVRRLIELGQIDLAENRPQQLAHRVALLPETVRWHFIGHLQRNKVELVLPVAACIHSVDSLRLLRSLAESATKTGRTPQVLLEVNISGEASKGGFSPTELVAAWNEIQRLHAVSITGLMTMAPLSDDPESARPVFLGLRELRDRLAALSEGKLPLPELSMGMSGDYEVAVEEGATMVRVGSRLFAGLGDTPQSPASATPGPS